MPPRQPTREPEPSYARRREEHTADATTPPAAQPGPQRQPRQPRPVEFDDPNYLDIPDFLK